MATLDHQCNSSHQLAFGKRSGQVRGDTKVHLELVLGRQEGVPAAVLTEPVVALATKACYVRVIEYPGVAETVVESRLSDCPEIGTLAFWVEIAGCCLESVAHVRVVAAHVAGVVDNVHARIGRELVEGRDAEYAGSGRSIRSEQDDVVVFEHDAVGLEIAAGWSGPVSWFNNHLEREL